MTPAPPQLKTRKPTGQVAYPLLLVEGSEKMGKTYSALSLSSSERVGRTFVLELDEPTADEYASLGDFEILEHNGTYSSILEQLEAAAAVPMEDDKPNVIILDTGTALWKMLSKWADSRARNSRRGQKQLSDDPDAEVDVAMNLWNDATDRWYKVIYLLRNWPGIGIMIARSKETAKVVNGQPVAGQTDYKIEAQKSTANEVSAVVRMEAGHVARLVAVRSLHVDIPAKGLVLDAENPLEHLVFNVLGAGGDFQASSAVPASLGMTVIDAKTRLLDKFKLVMTDGEAAKAEALAIWSEAKFGNVAEVNEAQFAAVEALADKRVDEIKAQTGSVMELLHDLSDPKRDAFTAWLTRAFQCDADHIPTEHMAAAEEAIEKFATGGTPLVPVADAVPSETEGPAEDVQGSLVEVAS